MLRATWRSANEEELTRAEFGTLVHQILEQVLIRKLKGKEADRLVTRFTQDLGEKMRQEILEMVRRFIQSEEAQALLKSRAFHAELPFVLRLPHGLIHGKADLVYQNQKGDWIVLDYKTSVVDESSFAARGEEYRIQLELYALALSKILGVPPAEARIHFLRPSLTHRIPFAPDDFEKFFQKFTDLQSKIIEFRKERLLSPLPVG